MLNRIKSVLHARNLEFLRDRSSLGWNIILPVLLVFGFSILFSNNEKPLFKVAILNNHTILEESTHPFLNTQYIHFFSTSNKEKAIHKVSRHQTDMLINFNTQPVSYWVNNSSAKGYITELLLKAADPNAKQVQNVTGNQIRYVDWLIPGILGMNMMFSCLFGVGYVIVRYRKSGYLKRLSATPLSAFEFLVAQIGSRLLLILAITILVFMGTHYFINFTVIGNYFNLLVVTILGITSMISMSLMIAARVSNEELASGLLNLLSWPMMILSGVWFSMEGTPRSMQIASDFFPLTHLLKGARAIMLDGANLMDISYHLIILTIMTVLFLIIGSLSFKWSQN